MSIYTTHSIDELQRTGVYRLEHTSRPRIYYVGSVATTGFKQPRRNGFYRRFLNHLLDFENQKHHSRYLQRVVNKYGLDSLKLRILEFCEPEDCVSREQYWIDHYNVVESGYNSNPNASSPLGVKRSEEFKEKLRVANKAYGERSNTREQIYNITRGKAWSHVPLDWTPFNDKKPVKDISVNGIIYASTRDAAKVLGVHCSTVPYRIKSKDPKFKEYKYKGEVRTFAKEKGWLYIKVPNGSMWDICSKCKDKELR